MPTRINDELRDYLQAVHDCLEWARGGDWAVGHAMTSLNDVVLGPDRADLAKETEYLYARIAELKAARS